MKAPKFGVDWPSEDQYDNERQSCAFNGAFAHPIVDSLIAQCASKTRNTAARNIPTTCPPVESQSEKMDSKWEKMDEYENEYVKYCPTDKGMWGGGYTPSMECVIQYFGRNFSPG